MVFLQMATAEPLPGKERELIERMKGFAEFLKPLPGLVNTFVLREEGTGALVGLSIWQDKASFEGGIREASTQPPKTPMTENHQKCGVSPNSDRPGNATSSPKSQHAAVSFVCLIA
jgi:heme-degrading monooxygenase HmoA